jgi:hypothetical protein
MSSYILFFKHNCPAWQHMKLDIEFKTEFTGLKD